MKILFDQGTPLPLRRQLTGHTVHTAHESGWSEMENGALLRSAEEEGFDLLITTDRNLNYQQNLKGRRIAILVLMSTSWPKISSRVADIQASIDKMSYGDYVEQPI